MSVHTRSQKLAQKAYASVSNRAGKPEFDEYEPIARKFPALIHTCGLAQAVAFAQAKKDSKKRDGGPECLYLADLAAVLQAGGHTEVNNGDSLASHTLNDPLATYLRLSRDAIDAAVWLKRYAEALAPDVPAKPEGKK